MYKETSKSTGKNETIYTDGLKKRNTNLPLYLLGKLWFTGHTLLY